MRQAAVQQCSTGHACTESAQSASHMSWPHVQVCGAAFSDSSSAIPQRADIPDPFYDDNSGLPEAERLRLVIRQMQSACKGLLQQLIDLQHR